MDFRKRFLRALGSGADDEATGKENTERLSHLSIEPRSQPIILRVSTARLNGQAGIVRGSSYAA